MSLNRKNRIKIIEYKKHKISEILETTKYFENYNNN